MASGLIYRKFPKQPPIKFYGFEKVDRHAEAEIVERLIRPTTSYRIASEDVWTSEKPRHYSGSGAQYPRAKTRCPKYSVPDDTFEKRVVRPSSSGMTSLFSGKESVDRSTLSREKYIAEARIDKIFRRLQRNHTECSRQKRNIPLSTAEAEEKSSRPKSVHSTLSSSEPPDNVIALDSTDSRDIIQLIHNLEDRRNEYLRLSRLRRPTTSSSSKHLGNCIFCDETEQLGEWWQPTSSTPNGVNKREAARDQRKLVRRMRQPTLSSQNMCSQPEHVKVCRKHAHKFREQIHTKDLPLISGLPRSKNLDEINNRLMMRYRYDDNDQHYYD